MGHETEYLEYGGLSQRIMTAVIGMLGASVWSMYLENSFYLNTAIWHNHIFASWTSTASKIWPPSAESAPTLSILILIFCIKVKKTFFQHEETAQIKRVRETKRRLLLAQMTQALRWDEREHVEDGDKECEVDGNADATKTKKPPSAADLFDMLYDDVEERHVTDYGILADSEPYLSTFALFKERLAADFKDYVKFTDLARCQARGEDIASMDTEMDNAQMKHIPEFLDGTKLAELVDLFTKKIRKAFGKSILDHALLQAAKKCKSDLSKEQRKGVSMLWPHLRPILPMYGFAVCLMIFDAANGTVVYHSSKALLDEVGDGSVTVKELGPLVLQTYIKFTFCVFAHLSSWAFTHKVTAEFRLSVRNEVMANMVRQDMKFFDFYPSGILQERLNNDAEQLSSKMFQLPVRLIECFVRLSSCVLMLYSLDPQLFSVVAFPVPVIAVACNFIIRYMQTLQQRQRKIGESAAATTMEVLKEIRTVREFAMEGEESEKFAANSAYRAHIEQYANAMHHIVLIAPLFCLFEGMRFLCTYLGGCFVAGGQLRPGQAVMAAGLAGDMTHIVRSFFDIIPEIVKTLQPLGRVCDMLSAKPQIEPHPGSESKLKPERIEGAIEFINVNFTFPSEPLKQVLFNLSWSVSPGEKIGFVGGTGCGKSTSLYLIERWYNPQSGSILLDGRSIADYDVHHLRRHMSVVAQTTCLFSTTIRENLVYGLPYETRKIISDREIERALKQANAWDFVNEFPRKLETYAGERGVKLSGGQKQRLAIARALIRKPTIILLDEATSALDSKAEAVVQKALDNMIDENAKGCSIIIAHRLSTLRTCNRILVMDKGSVKESGSHDELMQIKVQKDPKGNMITGWYRDLYETQHGKNKAAGELLKVQFELEVMKKTLAAVTQENVHLKEDAVKTFKFSKARRVDQMLNELVAPPTLCLVRHTSETCPTNIADIAPQPLTIQRARTTPAW